MIRFRLTPLLLSAMSAAAIAGPVVVDTNSGGFVEVPALSEISAAGLSGSFGDLTDEPTLVGQSEAETGTATTARLWSAERVAQAISALESGGGAGLTLDGGSFTDLAFGSNITLSDDGDGTATANVSTGSATVGDGDYGDVSVSGSGTVWTVDAVGASVVTVHEAAIEGVLDLQNLQGAVTDAQVPNTITIDLATTATTALAGDTATAFFSSGTIEAARLPDLSGTYLTAESDPAFTAEDTLGELNTRLGTSIADGPHTTSLAWASITGVPSLISQVEAEAGVATTERFWSAQRVAQAVAALESPTHDAATVADTATLDLTLTGQQISGNVIQSGLTLSNLGGAVTDGQVPNTITVDLAATATALAANGANCSAGQYPLGVNASGAVESCTALPTTIPWQHERTVSEPADADDWLWVKAKAGLVLTAVDCVAQGTTPSITVDIQECDSNGANCVTSLSSVITCNGGNDAGTISDAAIDSGDWIKMLLGAPTGTVDAISVQISGIRAL